MDENLKQKLRDVLKDNISVEIRYLEKEIETFAGDMEKDIPSMESKDTPEYLALKTALDNYKKALQKKAEESWGR